MLKRLHLRNFTVFEDADFEFGPGLNVIVGANGTGKSHVLKVGYAVEAIREAIKNNKTQFAEDKLLAQYANEKHHEWGIRLVFYLTDTFLAAGGLFNLIRIDSQPRKTFVDVAFGPEDERVSFEFAETQKPKDTSLDITSSELTAGMAHTPVFVPAKEVLTMGWLLPLYDRREIPIDETYPDLLRLLMGPPLRQPEPAHIVAQLQKLIGGKVEEEGGRFYLASPNQPRMEMNLVAEGFRKFATLYKLLANGTLTPETTLFWDEPEANLNPALLKEMAAVLAELARAGFQIILATHSLFLLKELHILSREKATPVKYFGLSAKPGEATTVTAADNLELLPDIVTLDAELEQSDHFQRILDQEDADHN